MNNMGMYSIDAADTNGEIYSFFRKVVPCFLAVPSIAAICRSIEKALWGVRLYNGSSQWTRKYRYSFDRSVPLPSATPCQTSICKEIYLISEI